MTNYRDLRDHLIKLLQGGQAFAPFETAVENFPFEMRGTRAPGFDHSAWQLLEHIRIAQWDIVEFSLNRKHASPEWPEGYWPKDDAPASEKDWQSSIKAIKKDLEKMRDVVTSPTTDLFAKIPHGTGQTILREALLIAEHNAYHLGQLVMLRKILGIWPPR